MDVDFSVMYPDRGMLNETYPFNTICYKWNSKGNSIIQMVKYMLYGSEIIRGNEFDFIFALGTGSAVLMAGPILRSKKKYIVDVRDYTREDNWLYYKIEEKILRQAECVVISSPRFREFLPPKLDYVDVYNISNQSASESEFKLNRNLPIVIGYVGTVAYPDQVELLMKLVENDSRFRFEIYGNDPNEDRISRIITENNYSNSSYNGPYAPEEKPEIVKSIDILFNAYGNDSALLKYAISNKFTDAAIYKKVVLNSPGTSMHSSLGMCSFALDLKEASSLDGLYEWYSSLNKERVQKYLSELLINIIETNRKAKKKIIEKCGLDKKGEKGSNLKEITEVQII